MKSATIDALLSEARQHFLSGRPEQAEARYRQVLALAPRHPIAGTALAEIMSAAGRHPEAVAVLRQLVDMHPGEPANLRRLGAALLACSQFGAALTVLSEAVRLDPANARGHNNLGEAWFALGDADRAAASYRRAIECEPRHAGAHNNLGRALHALRKFDEAASWLGAAIELAPTLLAPHINLGNVCISRGDTAAAARSYERALALDPRSAEAWLGKAGVAHAEHRVREALELADRALAIRPGFVQALMLRAQLLQARGEVSAAQQSLEAAVTAAPQDASALNELAMLLGSRGDLTAARDCLDRLEALAPHYPYAAGYRLYVDLCLAQWHGFEPRRAAIERGIEAGRRVCSPFQAALLLAVPRLQRRCAEIYAADRYPPLAAAAARPSRPACPNVARRPIVGYLSADFHDHATAHLLAGVFAAHDRARFEIVALSIGSPRQDWMSQRLEHVFGKIEQLAHLSDAQCAAFIAAREVDILVDLKGYTLEARPGILSRKPAPIQVNYLGFPGTLGVSYIDYLLADVHVIPADEAVDYAENLVYLPVCYQANDAAQASDPAPPSRGECGLPDDAFVYCCFNAVHKLTPVMFEAWMRILARNPHGVLWLLDCNPIASANLRRSALQHGIEPSRLVFAAAAAHPRHLARYRNADLFLDTTPYNAHTTASDALFAGCPILTVAGSSFAGRVCASLLHAVGIPELIAQSLPEYEALAVELGRNAAVYARFRQRFSECRIRAPLFDTARFTRELEAAYARMWARYTSGLPPAPFQVTLQDAEHVAIM